MVLALAEWSAMKRRLEMHKIAIELPETYDVASRGKSVTVRLADLSPDIVAQLALHGLRQKVADAAASAAKASEGTGLAPDEWAKVAMQKVVDALVAGEWAQRTASDGASAEVRMRRTVLGEMLRKTDKGKAEWKAHEDDRGEWLDAVFAKQPEKVQAAIMAAVEKRMAEAAEKAKQAKALAAGLEI